MRFVRNLWFITLKIRTWAGYSPNNAVEPPTIFVDADLSALSSPIVVDELTKID